MRLLLLKSVEIKLAALYSQLYYAEGWENGLRVPVSDMHVGNRLDYGYFETMGFGSEIPDSMYGPVDEWRKLYQEGVSNAVVFKQAGGDIVKARKLSGKRIRKPIKSVDTLIKLISKLENSV